MPNDLNPQLVGDVLWVIFGGGVLEGRVCAIPTGLLYTFTDSRPVIQDQDCRLQLWRNRKGVHLPPDGTKFRALGTLVWGANCTGSQLQVSCPPGQFLTPFRPKRKSVRLWTTATTTTYTGFTVGLAQFQSPKCFAKSNLFNPQINPMRQILLLVQSYRWGNQSTEWWR